MEVECGGHALLVQAIWAASLPLDDVLLDQRELSSLRIKLLYSLLAANLN